MVVFAFSNSLHTSLGYPLHCNLTKISGCKSSFTPTPLIANIFHLVGDCSIRLLILLFFFFFIAPHRMTAIELEHLVSSSPASLPMSRRK